MLTRIEFDGKLLAVILDSTPGQRGVTFVTPNEFSQQLALIHHPQGHVIPAHVHNTVPREVRYTRETLFIRSGKIRVDLYDDNRKYVESRILSGGDVLLLVHGGHGFEVIEEVDMVEVKQGPYSGVEDKIRFDGIAIDEVRIKS